MNNEQQAVTTAAERVARHRRAEATLDALERERQARRAAADRYSIRIKLVAEPTDARPYRPADCVRMTHFIEKQSPGKDGLAYGESWRLSGYSLPLSAVGTARPSRLIDEDYRPDIAQLMEDNGGGVNHGRATRHGHNAVDSSEHDGPIASHRVSLNVVEHQAQQLAGDEEPGGFHVLTGLTGNPVGRPPRRRARGAELVELFQAILAEPFPHPADDGTTTWVEREVARRTGLTYDVVRRDPAVAARLKEIKIDADLVLLMMLEDFGWTSTEAARVLPISERAVRRGGERARSRTTAGAGHVWQKLPVKGEGDRLLSVARHRRSRLAETPREGRG